MVAQSVVSSQLKVQAPDLLLPDWR